MSDDPVVALRERLEALRGKPFPREAMTYDLACDAVFEVERLTDEVGIVRAQRDRCYERSREEIERLRAALREAGDRIRAEFNHDALWIIAEALEGGDE